MKERVIELINQIGNSLDSPYYAEKILTECGKEILQIVDNLEEQIEILKRKFKTENGGIKMGDIFREDLFRLEVNTGSGGYGFTDTLSELMKDVENEYGDEVKAEVEAWALNSKERDEFQKYGMYITNIGR